MQLSEVLALNGIVGPLTRGHYIQIGMGIGFYVPEADYQLAQSRANQTRLVQFLAVTRDGRAVHGSRRELLDRRDLAAGIAWIVPQN